MTADGFEGAALERLNIYYIFFSHFAPSGGETKRYENDAAVMTQLVAIGSFELKKIEKAKKIF